MATAMRSLAAAVLAGFIFTSPTLRADDAKDKAALRAELLKLNKISGDDAQREALLGLIKDKPKARLAVVEAMKMAKEAKDESPFKYNACLILAKTAHIVKDFKSAAFFYEECVDEATKLESGGKILQSYDGLLDLYFDAKRYQDAIDLCEKFLDLKGPDEVKDAAPFILERQVQAMARAGQTDQALAMAEKLVKLDGGGWYFLMLKGYVLHEDGKLDAAIETYTESLGKLDANKKMEKEQKDRFKDRIHYILSGLYVEAKDIDKATKELEGLIKRNPENPTYKNDLGFIWCDVGLNLEQSEKLIREALDLDEKRQKKALEEGLIDEVKPNAAYLDSLGWVLYKQKKYKEAIDYLTKATADEEEGNHLEIWDHLADCYMALGDKKKAAETWEKGLKLEDIGPRDKERRRLIAPKLREARAATKDEK